MPWVKTLDLRNGEISATDECVTDLAVQETSLQVYPPGTVLVAMYGGFNQIGRTGLLRIPACVNQALSAIQVNRNRVVPEYLLAVLNFRVEHWKAVASSSRKDPNITGNDVRAFELPLPSMEEQRSIAAALSDVDALLIKLGQLIAKKRDLKQAVLQQLLSGRNRLHGFVEAWEERPFARVLSRVNSKRHQIQTSEYLEVGAFPVVDQGQKPVVAYSDRSDKAFKCPSGGVIVFGDHTCIIKYVDFDFVVGADGTQLLTAKPGVLARYVAYQLENSGVESTGYNRHFKFLAARSFSLPGFNEQEAIVGVLADMDAEIAALEARRDKTRQLKQGMMQSLLTGRIRLV